MHPLPTFGEPSKACAQQTETPYSYPHPMFSTQEPQPPEHVLCQPPSISLSLDTHKNPDLWPSVKAMFHPSGLWIPLETGSYYKVSSNPYMVQV